MNIYIDIDGVLLTKSGKIPEHAPELIKYLTENHTCYWLTTHCRGGENKVLEYLSKVYGKEEIGHLNKVCQTDWMDLKTEAIDFASEFIWLDDNPFNAEKVALKKQGCQEALIVVDLNRKDELKEVMSKIRRVVNNSLKQTKC